MTEQQATEYAEACLRARELFITEENTHGCAETTLIVLQEAYGLPDPTDSSVAMALNGGVAWSGGVCGAISGAAMAVGRLAGQRVSTGACINDHKEAKRVARAVTAELMDSFRREYGAVNCRDLIGLDISTPEGHTAFIEGQVWHTVCMAQIEHVLGRLLYLRDERAWQDLVRSSMEEDQ